MPVVFWVCIEAELEKPLLAETPRDMALIELSEDAESIWRFSLLKALDPTFAFDFVDSDERKSETELWVSELISVS